MSTWAETSYTEWAVPGYSGDRLLGRGVAGTVVAAVNESNGQRVAIKYLNEDLVRDSEFLAEFRATAQQLTSLNAPHVAGVIDYAEQPGVGAAVVTQLVEGVSLRKMITRRGPLSAKAALVVLKDSLLGLAAAHSRRVAHRDVKPDNVLIDANGWCTLTDFGLAVQTDKQVPVPGTPEYMAPELWNGAPNFPATDVYAATVMLCESLTGKPPFTGRAAALREQHESQPVPLDQYEPPLRDLIGWGMAKYSDRRPPSAWAFVGELDARAADAYGPNWEDEGRSELAQRARELLARPEGDGGDSVSLTRQDRRRALSFAAIAAVVIVVVAGAAGAVALTKKPPQLSTAAAADVSAAATVKTPVVISKCSTPATITFTGSITDQQPGKVSYQWDYSTGQNGPIKQLTFAQAGTQQVTGTLTTNIAGDGTARLNMLLNPGSKASNEVTYSLLCSAGNGGINALAKLTPATLNEASCAVPNPTLTATGTITASNAGPVTYYWQTSDGTKSTPAQVTFSKAGTQPVKPLKFQTRVPEAGSAILVVSKPAVATSTAAFSVTCPQANNAPAPVPTAAQTSAKPTPSKSVAPSKSVSPSPTTHPTTAAPTTAAPTTAAPTTAAPTTATPTTATPTATATAKATA